MRFYRATFAQICRQQLNSLTGPQEDSYLLDPDEIRLNQLKAEVGAVSLKSLTAELAKLEILRAVGVPGDLFTHLCERVETESLTELRRHPDPIRYTRFCPPSIAANYGIEIRGKVGTVGLSYESAKRRSLSEQPSHALPPAPDTTPPDPILAIALADQARTLAWLSLSS